MWKRQRLVADPAEVEGIEVGVHPAIARGSLGHLVPKGAQQLHGLRICREDLGRLPDGEDGLGRAGDAKLARGLSCGLGQWTLERGRRVEVAPLRAAHRVEV